MHDRGIDRDHQIEIKDHAQQSPLTVLGNNGAPTANVQQHGTAPLILSDPLQLAGGLQESGRAIHTMVGS
jgi:hypothetical protein